MPTNEIAKPAAQSIASMLGKMNSVSADRFVRVMTTLCQQGSPEEISRLEHDLKAVKVRIDEVNAYRTELSHRKADLAGTLDDLRSVRESGWDSVEVVHLELLLSELVKELDDEIANLRPHELHSAKAQIRQEIVRRQKLSALGSMLMREQAE